MGSFRLACAAALLLASLLPAQQKAGELRLAVHDSSGAALSAGGYIRYTPGGAEQPFETNAQGVYTATGLTVGRYQVEVRKSGFSTQSFQLDVTPTIPAVRIVTLELQAQATTISVVSVTPLTGTDLAIEQIPAPVQAASAKNIEDSGALDLADFMNRRLDSVHVNENQENPYQPDINYRGYTASPLLGTPQGLSVYADGVRQNQPFGDVVAWDLIPKLAIDEMSLMPGSDPIYGLNSLGGAISVQTKSGLSHPGTSLQASGGSFGRRAGEIEHGGAKGAFNWYFAGNLYREDGWRQLSPSEVRQAFGKLGWVHSKTTAFLSFSYADNWLTGNGLQDFRRLPQNYSAIYNVPDITWNRSPALTLSVQHAATSHLTFSGVAYFRYIRADTLNANTNPDSYDQSLYNLSSADIKALTAAGYTGFPTTGNSTTEPAPYWRCIAQALEFSEPSEKCTGFINTTGTKQNNFGASGLLNYRTAHNQLSAGFAIDHSTLTFRQGIQFAYLNADHLSFTPIPFYEDGTSNSDGVPVDGRVNLHGRVNTPSFYATDTLTLGKWNFTVSGRYNRVTVNNVDRLPPVTDGSRGSLNGNYSYPRFNPAAGLTWNPNHHFGVYFSYSESSRAPTAVELGCADPNNPCNLPNALVGDPPLDQVITRTFEAGIRSGQESRLRWSAGMFRGMNYNDLLFVSSPQTGFGYFTNFGKTRRQGIETSISDRIAHFTMGGNYTFLDATYQSPQTVDGGANSTNESALAGQPGIDDNINIAPGNRIPQTPRHLFKAYGGFNVASKFDVDLELVAVSSSFARGNENNLDKPDGVFYLGPGVSPGYAVVDMSAHYHLNKHAQAFIQINNLLDRRYSTAAQLGPSPYDNSGNFIARPFAPIQVDGQTTYQIRHTTFLAPGAPIGLVGGIRYTF